MDLNSPLFDRVRIRPDEESLRARMAPRCQHPGCQEAGQHKAPLGRKHEGQYVMMCLPHVQAYNKSYNYFQGMSDEAIQDFQKDALTGHRPTAEQTAIGGTTLVLYAEHEFNASTFTARTIVSTGSDMHSGITGAIGALKGPLHGGANEQVLETLSAIGSADRAEAWVGEQFAAKRVVMGFGHRVYKDGDVRAKLLGRMCRDLARGTAAEPLEDLADRVERLMLDHKGLKPNLDWPAARVYHALGLPVSVFTPIFVVARMSGWTAHIIEQIGDNRLIRPLSLYCGAPPRDYRPLAHRK